MSLKFKLDENLPGLVMASMESVGLDVHTVADEGLCGADDGEVFRRCVAEGRILVTLDLDFADLRAYPPGMHGGIWVLRPPKQTFQAIDALVQAGLRLASIEPAHGRLWIIDERRVRIRGVEDRSQHDPSTPTNPAR